jgi:hypothetical protein
MKRRSQGRAAKYRDGRGEVETWDEPARRLRGVCVCERKSRLCRGLAQERGKRCDAEKYETDETADTTPREREREKGRRREETRNERKETESGFGWECKLYEIEEGGVEKKRQSDEQRAASRGTRRRGGRVPHCGVSEIYRATPGLAGASASATAAAAAATAAVTTTASSSCILTATRTQASPEPSTQQDGEHTSRTSLTPGRPRSLHLHPERET